MSSIRCVLNGGIASRGEPTPMLIAPTIQIGLIEPRAQLRRTGIPCMVIQANKAWKAEVVAVRGVIVKDAAKITSAVQALSDVFQYSPSGDGFYPDGSFIFHVSYPYNGGYGAQMVQTVGSVMQWLKGSTW